MWDTFVPRIEPFEKHREKYESWFDRNRLVYLSELEAVRKQLAKRGKSVEIGVGTGRFAAPLGIRIGIEPSRQMGRLARQRGIQVVRGVGENLPLGDALFDTVLMVTTLCFLDDVETAFAEAHRILKGGGCLIIGFIDRDSPLGALYQRHKEENPFYRVATFYSAEEVAQLLKRAGFRNIDFVQTIFRKLPEIAEIEAARAGYGEGSFLVVKGLK